MTKHVMVLIRIPAAEAILLSTDNMSIWKNYRNNPSIELLHEIGASN